MSTFTIKTNNVSTCCNLILWDFAFSVLAISSLLIKPFPNLSGFQCFLLGLLGAILLIGLMAIRLFRNILIFIFSVFWAATAYTLIDLLFHISLYSTPWRYGIGIFCFLIMLGIHLMSAEDFDLLPHSKNSTPSFTTQDFTEEGTILQNDLVQCMNLMDQAEILTNQVHLLFSDDDTVQDYITKNFTDIIQQYNDLVKLIKKFNSKNSKNTFNKAVLETTRLTLKLNTYINYLNVLSEKGNANSTNHHQQSKSSVEHEKDSTKSNYFNGCDTLEKVNKRYRDLVKVYHTDSGNGDTEIFIKITDEYNKLKNRFSN